MGIDAPDESEPEVDLAADLGIDLGGAALDRGLPLDDLAETSSVEEEPVAPANPPPAPASVPQPPPAISTSAAWTVPPLPDEPWFYGRVEGFADNLRSSGVSLLWLGGISLALMVVIIPATSGGNAPAGVILAGLISGATLMGAALAAFTSSALVHLALDHARNARSARHLIAAWVYRQAAGLDEG